MAYDATGARAGGAGHDAATIVAALIGAGDPDVSDIDGILATFDRITVGVFNSLNALAGAEATVESMEDRPRRSSGGGARRSTSTRRTSGGGNSNDPGSLDFRNGRYAGSTIAEVAETDEGMGYLEWCADNLKNEFMRDKIVAFLEAA